MRLTSCRVALSAVVFAACLAAGRGIADGAQGRSAANDAVGFPQSNAKLADLLWSMLESESSRALYAKARRATDPANPYRVGDHQLVDLDGDRRPELVATLSTTPRLVFSEVIVLNDQASRLRIDRLPVLNMEHLTGAIVDLGGDGTPELVVPTEYASGTGAHRIVWTAVLRWSGAEGFVDVGNEHKGFYEAQLDAAVDEVVAIEQQLSGNSTAINREVLAGKQMVLDRLMSVAARDVDAPVRRALGWSGSNDVALKDFAIRVFETFPTSAAVEKLQLLSADRDATIREHARLTLDVLRSRGRIR